MHKEPQQVYFNIVDQPYLKQEYIHLALVDHTRDEIFQDIRFILLITFAAFYWCMSFSCHLVMSVIFSHYDLWL